MVTAEQMFQVNAQAVVRDYYVEPRIGMYSILSLPPTFPYRRVWSMSTTGAWGYKKWGIIGFILLASIFLLT
jgi:hypothetical protein